MGGYIKAYMKSVDRAVNDPSADLEALKREHLVQIGFVQHERLVHLLVTIMVCILLFVVLGIFFISGIRAFLIIDGLLLILTFSYLLYYFFIENAAQRMYRQYNLICSKLEPENRTVCDILTDPKMLK